MATAKTIDLGKGPLALESLQAKRAAIQAKASEATRKVMEAADKEIKALFGDLEKRESDVAAELRSIHALISEAGQTPIDLCAVKGIWPGSPIERG